MSKSLWKNKVWIIFLILMFFLLPETISLPAQTDERSVAIAFGLDKTESEQVELLEHMGCTHIQGYYFSKPLPKAEFLEFIK